MALYAVWSWTVQWTSIYTNLYMCLTHCELNTANISLLFGLDLYVEYDIYTWAHFLFFSDQ